MFHKHCNNEKPFASRNKNNDAYIIDGIHLTASVLTIKLLQSLMGICNNNY